jgi:hypothetical protein
VIEINPEYSPAYGAHARTSMKLNKMESALSSVEKGYDLILKTHNYASLKESMYLKFNEATKKKPIGIPIDARDANWLLYIKAFCLK